MAKAYLIFFILLTIFGNGTNSSENYWLTVPPVKSVQPRKNEATTSGIFNNGQPTIDQRSAHAIGRQNLIELLSNPTSRHLNLDDRPIVMITLIPIKIQDLDEKKEVLETTIRLQLSWEDKRLSWDPRHFSNITEVIVSPHAIWTPDIAVLNSVSDVYDVVRDKRFEVKVESTGRLWWHPTGITKTYCKLLLRYFPFDRQLCWIVFESPTLDVRFMNLTLRNSNRNAVDTRMFLTGETWTLLAVGGRFAVHQVGAKTAFSRVEFYMHIERAKIYHILNVILPAVFLSCVQIMFFLVPATHPQRVGSSTTTLLSVVVFQTVAISHLPNTSTDVPLLTIYIFFVVIVSALSVTTSIIVAKFAVCVDQKTPLPTCLAKLPHPIALLHCCRHRGDREKAALKNDDVIDIIFADPSLTIYTSSDQQQQQQAIIGFSHTEQPIHEAVVHRTSCQHCGIKTMPSSSAAASSLHPPLVPVTSIRGGLIVDKNGRCHLAATRSLSVQSTRGQQTVDVNNSHRCGCPMASVAERCHHHQHQNLQHCASSSCSHQNNNNRTPDVIIVPPPPQFADSSDLFSTNNFSTTTNDNIKLDWCDRRLFNNWKDVSWYVDTFLMLIAASIAIFTPILLFIVVPGLATDVDPNTAKLST